MYFFKINKLVRDLCPKIVISFTIKPNIYSGIISKLNRIPHIMTVSGLGSAYHSSKLPKWFYFYVYSLAIGTHTFAFFENDYINQIFQSRKIRFLGTKVINGSGVDLEKFKSESFPSGKPFRFLYIGRIMNEKGIQELLSASISLLNQNYDFELYLVGEVTSQISNFTNDLSKILTTDKIKFLGYVDDVSAVIRDSHVIVHPSYHEGMANALLEGAACGRPLLASNIPGCKEIIDHNQNGLLFEPKSQINICF
jgi:glycosyltransferase involved in cell wall biosynthesis